MLSEKISNNGLGRHGHDKYSFASTLKANTPTLKATRAKQAPAHSIKRTRTQSNTREASTLTLKANGCKKSSHFKWSLGFNYALTQTSR